MMYADTYYKSAVKRSPDAALWKQPADRKWKTPLDA
jgi:hypothetical protein